MALTRFMTTRKTMVGVALAVALALLSLSSNLSSAATPTLYLNPPTFTAAAGQIFPIQILVDSGAAAFDTVDAYLDFDWTCLDVVDAAGNPVTSIPVNTADFPATPNYNVVDDRGKIDLSISKVPGSPPDLAGTYVLASFYLRAKAGFSTTIINFSQTSPRLSSLYLAGRDIPLQTLDGTMILPAAMPTTTSAPTNTLPPTGAPTNTPTATGVPANTPTATGVPANTPTATGVPANTPTATGVPANTPTATGVPANTPTALPAPMATTAPSDSGGGDDDEAPASPPPPVATSGPPAAPAAQATAEATAEATAAPAEATQVPWPRSLGSQPASVPPGVPAPGPGGSIWITPPMAEPGISVVKTVIDGQAIELMIPIGESGQSLVVRLGPQQAEPGGSETGGEGRETWRLRVEIFRYHADGTATRLTPDEVASLGAVTFSYQVGAFDWQLIVADSGGNSAAVDGRVVLAALSRFRNQAVGVDTSRLVFYLIADNGELMKLPTTWQADPAEYGTLSTVFKARQDLELVLVVLPPGEQGRRVLTDGQYFKETGFRIVGPEFWDYFQRRGGLGSFGYPISREFLFLGTRVQMFQRGIMQMTADGGVATLNLLDAGLLPYAQINFSHFPEAERELIDSAPTPDDPDFGAKAIAFLKANVPDQWDGLPVGFLKAYLDTVRYENAFPRGEGDPALVPLLSLELMGLPTSRPAYDPSNHNFVYQRFQRGILHFDLTTDATQKPLLADYLKSVLIGRNLPADLEEQAGGSYLFKQYDRTMPSHLTRPAELPATNLMQAFEPDVPEEVIESDAP